MPHPLFTPFEMPPLTLKNRSVMAPMTRSRAGEGDVPTALTAEYYAQRAGAGLIVSEGIPVSPQGRGYLWTPGLYTDEQVDGWRRVSDAVHAAGGLIFGQIWHVGRISHPTLQPDRGAPVGPTGVAAEGAMCFALDEQAHPANVAVGKPKALDAGGIHQVREAFAGAARRAREAGLDGVEIHGANGYLFDQFLNSVVNTRDDAYGGTPENRCRLLLEVVDAVSAAIGAERTGVRISPNGRFNAMPEDPHMLETFVYLAAELDRRGVAYLHVNDQATFGLPALPPEVLTRLRSACKRPLIVCGGYDSARAREVLDAGLADLVAFGVPFLANPDLPERLERDLPLNQPDSDTFYGGGARGYTDYPRYGG